MTPSAPLAFIDTETTGLDPDRHQLYEIAVITDDGTGQRAEHTWWIAGVDLSTADPDALRISRYYQRTPTAAWEHPDIVAREVAELTAGRHLVGAVPSFDAAFVNRFLRANGHAPSWHYHLVDVEALAAGYLAAGGIGAAILGPGDFDPRPPWKSDLLSQAVGVQPDRAARHTALGDARWAAAIYDAVMRHIRHIHPADAEDLEHPALRYGRRGPVPLITDDEAAPAGG